MDEKRYRTVKTSGALNLVAGIISITVGVTMGILLIISGAKLLASKSNHLF